jgi:hypothetical protein
MPRPYVNLTAFVVVLVGLGLLGFVSFSSFGAAVGAFLAETADDPTFGGGRLAGTVPPLAEGHYVVTLKSPEGAAPARLEVAAPLRDGETVRRDLVLAEPWFGGVRGRIVDRETGLPLAGASLTIEPADAEAVPASIRARKSRWAYLGESSTFEVAYLEPGRWRLRGGRGQRTRAERTVDVRAGEVVDVGDLVEGLQGGPGESGGGGDGK